LPVASTGALNSWGLYLIASAALVLMLGPPLTGVARDSREGADWRSVDGVRQVLDGLRPGIALDFSYGSSPTADSIHLAGSFVSCDYGSGTISLPSRWTLPSTTLLPTVHYTASLTGEEVQVAQLG
jgi:hypothetical protein